MTRECGHNRSQHPPPVFSPACSLSLQWLDSLDPAQLAALALERCGDNLTRENLLKQVTTMKDVELGLLLPGMKVNYRPDDYYPIRQAQLVQFDGKSWKPMMSELVTFER